MNSHSASWRSILILSSHLHLRLPGGLFPSCFPTKTLDKPLLSPHTCYMPNPSHSPRFDHPNSIWWGVQIISSSMYVLQGVYMYTHYSVGYPCADHLVCWLSIRARLLVADGWRRRWKITWFSADCLIRISTIKNDGIFTWTTSVYQWSVYVFGIQ